MFRGLARLSLDAKGRLALPARHREALRTSGEETLVLTIDMEQPCLLLYPEATYLDIERQIAALPSLHPLSKRLQRTVLGHASPAALDSAGRLLVPPELREYAGLDKTVALVGVGKKFELWDEAAFKAHRDALVASHRAELEQLPAALEELSL